MNPERLVVMFRRLEGRHEAIHVDQYTDVLEVILVADRCGELLTAHGQRLQDLLLGQLGEARGLAEVRLFGEAPVERLGRTAPSRRRERRPGV